MPEVTAEEVATVSEVSMYRDNVGYGVVEDHFSDEWEVVEFFLD